MSVRLARYSAVSTICLLAACSGCGDGPDPVPAEPTEAALPAVGDCLKHGAVEIAGVVSCDSPEAYFRVLAIDRGSGQRVCPPETDYSTGWVGAPVSLCLARLR